MVAYSDCVNGSSTSPGQNKWGLFQSSGSGAVEDSVYAFGDACEPSAEWDGVYSLYVLTDMPITTTTTTTTLEPQPWDWGGVKHGGFTLSFSLTIGHDETRLQGLFMRLHRVVDPNPTTEVGGLGFKALEQSDHWASPTTPGATLKQLYLDASKRLCFKVGSTSRWGHCHPRKLEEGGRMYEVGLRSSSNPSEGYMLSVDGVEDTLDPAGIGRGGWERLSPDEPSTDFMFGFPVENPNYSFDRYRLSRFTGMVSNVVFRYHDGTPVVSALEAVVGLSPAAVQDSPWTLLLRSSDLMSGSLGDFSSGNQMGDLNSLHYRIGLTGEQLQTYLPVRLRIRTSFGFSDDFAGPFDFRAFDDVCTTCTGLGSLSTCSTGTPGAGTSNCVVVDENCTGMCWCK